LEALAKLPEGIARQQHELDLLLALGPALIATQGWAAQATGETYTRAGELCEQLGRQHHLGAVRFGQFTHQNLRGEFRLAHETGAAILQIGHARTDALLISLGHHFLGFSVLQRRNERRGRRCRKAAWKMRAGPSGSAFRSGSQTTPSCFGPMAEVVSVGAKARGTTPSRCASERRTKVNPSMTRR